MTKERLIILASESKMLRNLAAKLCNHRDIHNDLFQEAMLYLWEKEDDFLINKFNNAEFIGYCVLTIKMFNSHRNKANTLINTKCPLSERHNSYELKDFDIAENEYNYEVEEQIEKIVKFAKGDKFKTQVLFQSAVTSTRQIAQDLGVNQRQLIYNNNKFKSELKQKLR